VAILILGALAERALSVTVTGESPVVDIQQSSPVTVIDAELFERLPQGRDVKDLLILVPGMVNGQKIDQVQVGLGKGLAGAAKPKPGVGDWNWQSIKGGYLSGTPPVLIDGLYTAGGFTLPKNAQLPEKIEIQLYGNGKPLYGDYRPVRPLNPPVRLTDPAPALKLPEVIRPGGPIWFRPRDPKYTPGGGQWQIGPFTPKWNGSFDQPSYKFDIPLDYKFGSSWKVSYRDPWGTTLVDGPATGVAFGPPVRPSDGTPAVTGCSPATLADDTFCLCGDFPANSAADLLINGQSIGQYLVSVSPTIVHVALPADFPAGALDVSAGASSGFDIVDGARGTLIHVGGKIDRNRLKRGQSTSLELWLDGTDRATDLRLRNLTPGVVALENGNDQVVTTSGGTPNQVTRRVDAVSVGDFNLQYELAVGSCPCAHDQLADAGGDGEDDAPEQPADDSNDGRPQEDPDEPEGPLRQIDRWEWRTQLVD
jgi:hypothetical protein